MYVYGDERLKLDPLDLEEVPRGLVDESIQELQEFVVGFHHYLLVLPRLHQGQFGVPRPYHLYAQKTDLENERNKILCNVYMWIEIY